MLKNSAKLIVSSMALVGAISSSIALAEDNGFLIGLDVGQVDAHKYCHNISNCDHSDTSFRGNVGYQFDKYWSAELGYTSFGTLFKSHDNNFNANQKASAWTVSGIGTLPFGNRFGVFGRLGVARYSTDNSGTVQGVPVKDEKKIKPYAGVGAKFDITDRFLIRAEYQWLPDMSRVDGAKDDVQGLYAGATYRF